MATTLKQIDSPAVIINSMNDHVHILFHLSKNYALSKVVEEVKKSSSKWLKTKDPSLQKFGWQRGYAAFSVSQSSIDAVKHYIDTQNEHHRTRTFQEELLDFLTKYQVEYNEQYIWD